MGKIERRSRRRAIVTALAIGMPILVLAGAACTGSRVALRRGGPAPAKAAELSAAKVEVEFRALPFASAATYSGALVARDGRIFLTATRTGRPARLLAFDPRTGAMEVIATLTSNARRGGEDGKPLPEGEKPVLDDGPGGWIHGHDKIHARLFQGPDGCIYGATDSAVEGERPDSTRDYGGGHFFSCDPATGAVTDLGWARRHEGIIAMAADFDRLRLYGLTWPCGLLVCCRLQPEKDAKPGRQGQRGQPIRKGPRMSLVGLTSSGLEGVPRYFEVLADGRVVVCDGNNGDILVYLPPDFKGGIRPAGAAGPGKLSRPPALVTPFDADPSPPESLRGSTRFRNWWRTGTRSPEGLRVFTSGQRGGQLAEVDFTTLTLGRVVDHANAKPWAAAAPDAWGRDALTVMGFDPAGRLFYAVDGRLLSFDPARGEVRDHGTLALAGSAPEARFAVEPGPAGFDGKGRMYFGAAVEEPASGTPLREREGEAEDAGPDSGPGMSPPVGPATPDANVRSRHRAGLAWVPLPAPGEGQLIYTEPR